MQEGTDIWKRVVFYGALLAAGTLALQWLDYQHLARAHSGGIYGFLIAGVFHVLAREATLAKYAAEMERFKARYANPLFRLRMIFTELFPVRVLMSLISPALLRKPGFLPARRG